MISLTRSPQFLNFSNFLFRSFRCQANTNLNTKCTSSNMSETWDEDDREFQLYAETELRIDVAEKSKACLKLKRGSAECFGTELILDKRYLLRSGAKLSVFTWSGCTLLLTGHTNDARIVKDTSMVINANVHAAIEQMRQNAEINGKKGPTVLVTGPKDVGKSTLCRILLNYAIRQGRKPVFVDLDVGMGQISIPGTVGALRLESQIDLEDNFSEQQPLVYHFGFKSPGHNIILYDALVAHLADVMKSRIGNNGHAAVSGIVINTCGWVKSHGYRSLTHTALVFEVDVILVLGQERLYHQLRKDIPPFVKVVFIPKCGDVFERSKIERADVRDNFVKEYFYGFKKQLHPHMIEVEFSNIKIYRISSCESDDTYFPPGTKFFENKLCIVPVEIGFNLINHVLSVSFATSVDDVMQTNLAGFVCVVNINMRTEILTLLSPHPPPLPQTILLLSEVIFSSPGFNVRKNV